MDLKTSLQKFDWHSLAVALAMIALGLVLVIWPEQSNMVLVYIVGAGVTILGVVRTILFFARKERYSPFSVGGLATGLTLLAVGILLLSKPAILIAILPAALGCLLIFSGFCSLQTSIELMRLKIAKWFIPLIFALISIGLGILALCDPFTAADGIMLFLGASLMTEGVLLLITLILFQKVLKNE